MSRALSGFCIYVTALVASGASIAACDQPVAVLVSVQGPVEYSASGETQWHAAREGQGLCEGELVTVRRYGRATVRFEGDVLTRLDQFTTLQIAAKPVNGDAALGLREGIIHVISRLKKRVEVIAPVVNALVEGTEFTVTAKGGEGAVVVAEGRVRVSNGSGELVLEKGQAARVDGADAPRSVQIRPMDAVCWAMYYPIVARLQPENRDLSALVARGHYNEALALLGPAREGQNAVVRANLLLGVGRWTEANDMLDQLPVSADSAAVRAIILLTQGATAEARATIDGVSGQSTALALADSYVLQTEGRIDAALSVIQALTPDTGEDPLVWARRAELELTLGDAGAGRESARMALALEPGAARVKAMLGFSHMLSGQYEDADRVLAEAIEENASDPLAHYALGLTRIRQGELGAGRQSLETAVLLDPSNVEYRATLGRAYMAERQDTRAASQLELASTIDPASPSPRFFEAQRRLTQGDVIGAIGAGREALALNDSRLALRSPALLASDRAARASTLGAAYQAAGFDATLKRIASDAVESDSASGPAHRLMAQAYTDDLRYESARISEQFQSFIFGDIGQPMVMPQSLISALPVLEGARVMSLHETSAVFNARPYNFWLSGLAGTQETWGASVMATALNDRFQASIGHFDYRSDGFAPNSNVDISTTRAEFRARLTSDALVFADVQHNDLASNDISQAMFTNFDHFASDERSDLVRVGARYALSPKTSVVVLVANESGRQDEWTDRLSLLSGPFFSGQTLTETSLTDDFSRRLIGLRVDGQYSDVSLQSGVESTQEKVLTDGDTVDTTRILTPFPAGPFEALTPVDERADVSSRRLFAQMQWRATPAIEFSGRLNYVRHAHDAPAAEDSGRGVRDSERVLPSVGAQVSSLPGIGRVRAAFIQDVTTTTPGGQGLQPTRFAGLDATFDDVSGTRYQRWAVGFDREIGTRAKVGGEWSLRKLSVPGLCTTTDCLTRWRERRHQIYASASLTDWLGVETGWWYASLRNLDADKGNALFRPLVMRTETIPLRVFIQMPPNWRLLTEVLRARQDVENSALTGTEREHASFWMTNVQLQYAPAGDSWAVAVDVRNLFDQDALIQDTDLVTSDPKTPLWYPERSVFLSARFGF